MFTFTKAQTIFLFLLLVTLHTAAQSTGAYQYTINLKTVQDQRISVQLETPAIQREAVDFMIPGPDHTADELQAFDADGHVLPVMQQAPNCWTIQQAKHLHHLQYTLAAGSKNNTVKNIFKADSAFFLDHSAVLGCFAGMEQLAVDVKVLYPIQLYPVSGMPMQIGEDGTLAYSANNYNAITEQSILFSAQKPAHFRVGHTTIQVAVYSENDAVKSDALMAQLQPVINDMTATLDGPLPMGQYAFLFYFYSGPVVTAAAKEHATASAYLLPEVWAQQQDGATLKAILQDIARHEFFPNWWLFRQPS